MTAISNEDENIEEYKQDMSQRLKHAYKKGDVSKCSALKTQKEVSDYCDHLDDAHFDRVELCNFK